MMERTPLLEIKQSLSHFEGSVTETECRCDTATKALTYTSTLDSNLLYYLQHEFYTYSLLTWPV
jgi:hypothetical protein